MIQFILNKLVFKDTDGYYFFYNFFINIFTELMEKKVVYVYEYETTTKDLNNNYNNSIFFRFNEKRKMFFEFKTLFK